jgi:hypothetical protein
LFHRARELDGVEARAGALVVAERLVAALHRLDITPLGGTTQSVGDRRVLRSVRSAP